MNLTSVIGKALMQEFFKLYDHAANGLKRALPTARIGGPDVAGTSSADATKFLKAFIEHCISDTNYATGNIGSPLQLVSFHAKGSPRVVNGHVRMNMAPELRDIAAGFKMVASYPQTKNLPIVIGEADPEGCAACSMATNPENAYLNGTMYSGYTAASFARMYALVDEHAVNFLGAVSWSFEFENQPWFYGFRDLATNEVDKPVLNVFRMFGMMKGKRVVVQGNQMYDLKKVMDSSVRGTQTDIGALASKDKRTAGVMVSNYHDDNVQMPAVPIKVTITGLPAASVTLTQYLIDNEHSNLYEVWKKMGPPHTPTSEQIRELEKAGQLQTLGRPQKMKVKAGSLMVNISLSRQGVSLLKIDW